ncbi:MAG TPA: GGDEF domain-containing protein [Rhodocyclaceae bacterium]|nr:GGDEF domain-containing protein [Rhodocyclaceae bacterium]
MAPVSSADTLLLRRLLVLARDLLQVHDLKSVLELVGPAFRELSAPDDALLLVMLGDEEYVTAFDTRGLLQPVDQESVFYQHARQALLNEVPLVLPALSIDQQLRGGSSYRTASLLAIPFPPVRPIGVLAALWLRDGNPELLASQASILRHLSELSGAALGNVDFQLALEEQVSACTAEVRAVTREHAEELQRRDDTDREKDRIAVTDVLTGMLNRRGFFLQAERAFKVACRQGTASAVIFADIDNLKTVNDQLGHDIGDHLIQAGAQILRKSFRDSDVVARLGGDEFAAFTLNSGQPEAILARVQENTDLFHRQASTPYKVSFSLGIVPCEPSSALSLADYLSLADKKMYEHKKGRR